MEIRSKNILGLPVFSLTQGEKLGQVRDYVFHPEKRAIIALVIAGDKRLSEEKILPLTQIKSFGQEAITLAQHTDLQKKGEDAEIAAYLKKMVDIVGVDVITTEGGLLGRVAEFFLDSQSGKITYIVIRGGLFDQLLKGKSYLDAEMIDVFGSDVILAKDNAVIVSGKPRLNGGKKDFTTTAYEESEAAKGEDGLATEAGETASPVQERKTETKARSHSLWNQGKNIIHKTKAYTKKIPASLLFDESTPPKAKGELPQNDKKERKTTITYKKD